MKPLPLWVRVLLWFAGASLRDLLEPRVRLPPPDSDIEQRLLRLKLREVDGVLSVALKWQPERRWLQ